ncbi:MAG: peptide chain release factor 1 [candidate division Zixibacteria bacterium]|nr:peptide chain release factor 1 [candidate division Zixibacteria bacterium]NIR66051.1 peptide chain release factor 1 [candidate division Zixibacteria bacterium]NIS17135.1 peptide chain release factor 1 [candidate division Zixibacteria bacterium]NIS47681.1 peptide chain release factor 1 [candidate division Zixibacteria bacterium]NIT53490.1 peptide chain release factor 1 [candidate division Zixibacteria bacterium]
MIDIVNSLEAKLEKLDKKLSDPAVLSNQKKVKEISRERKELMEILEVGREYKKVYQTIKDDEKVRREESDKELLEMIHAELEELRPKLEELEEQLKLLLVPRDPNDVKNTIMEIRAGTGGEEAALFAADLFRMYQRYIEENGWRLEVMTSNPTGVGGFKEIIFLVEGEGVYGNLKFESGVHRVQRVPETEASGRIHTSAASVAVLPEAEDVDIDIDPNDLRIDVYRSSGPGGQSVNTTDSAVRITHIPTGLVVSCQDEKSQLKNKNKAMKVLRARLLDKATAEQNAARASQRKAQVSTGDRSAKIRTYNFPQGRLTDHRIGLTLYKLDSIMEGELDEVIEALKIEDRAERLNEIEVA